MITRWCLISDMDCSLERMRPSLQAAKKTPIIKPITAKDYMAIALFISTGLILVHRRADHVKYRVLPQASSSLAQAKHKARTDSTQNRLMFAVHINQRLREAGMLLSFALAGYFLVAMSSYDVQDPSWSHSGSNSEISNFGGTAGAWIADLSFYLFGFLAFLMPAMLIYNGMILVKTRDLSAEDRYQMLVIRWSGFVLTLISGCALASLHFCGGCRHHAARCRRHTRPDHRHLFLPRSRLRRRDGIAPGPVPVGSHAVHRPVVAGVDR